MKHTLKFFALLLVFSTYSSLSHAWGRRGHALVCENAAYLAVSQKPPSNDVPFLKAHSYDLGYYCNVPDFIWKRAGLYEKEHSNHFMDLENFEREIKESDRNSAFQLSRSEFEKKYKNISEKEGRSWWRIQELDALLKATTAKLQNKKLTRKERQALQGDWLLQAGVMGHYIGDLAMPLHVSENYNGQLTGQKGLHGYFEEELVDELYLQKDFGLQEKVYQEAFKIWPQFLEKNKNTDILTLIRELSKDSQQAAQKLLADDKRIGRANLQKAAQEHKALVVARLMQGTLYQAMQFYRHMDFEFDNNKFYEFRETPAFIEAPRK